MSTKIVCEVCKKEFEEIILEKHHINSKSFGGSDKSYNIATLCPKCHKYVHHGLIVLMGRFDSTQGNILVWRKYNESPWEEIIEPKVWLYPNAKVKMFI